MNKKINICIVEDEKFALDTLVEYLTRFESENDCNFSIDKFDKVSTFINNFESNYDIIFMDIELPDGSKPRSDANFKRNYIAGRYGAIPFILND